MTTEEAFTSLFSMLEEAGLQPEEADSKVASYDGRVPCGEPMTAGDVTAGGDFVLVPRVVLGSVPVFYVTVQGTSMRDAGLAQGDRVQVEMGVDVSDGDIVMVYIDGGFTVKTYFRDEQGQVWLVPQNPGYDAIRLTEEMKVMLIGRVTNIMRATQRCSYADCQRKVRQTLQKNGGGQQEVTEKQRDAAICDISSHVVHARQWYAVMRALVDRGVMTANEYQGFTELVRRLCPEHEHLPVASELRRMAVMSFRKKLAFWEEGDAPVGGQRFYDYLAIGNEMLGLLK